MILAFVIHSQRTARAEKCREREREREVNHLLETNILKTLRKDTWIAKNKKHLLYHWNC